MKQIITIFCLLMLSNLWGQTRQDARHKYFEILDHSPKDTLFRISKGDYKLGGAFGYVNQAGDTVVPYGRFVHSFTDTLVTYGIVVVEEESNLELVGINQQGQRLFEVFWFDNGPDYIEEGMFRILRDDKIGFADTTGQIVIEPQFECAYPFSDGRAKVTYDCELVDDGYKTDHKIMRSKSWFFIDKNGQQIK